MIYLFITFRKWTVYYLLCLIVLIVSFALIAKRGEAVQAIANAFGSEDFPILIIDPGHGGEDGGAVSADGTVESHINLSIALTSADLARFLGWEIVMTREEDISIHDDTAKTLREKKVSDLKNRVSLCDNTANGILISIHQNSMPSAKSVRGAQVFYNETNEGIDLAQTIQNVLNQTISSDHKKETKPIGSSSYLMKSVSVPAVLIECGFLSNETECQLLRSAEYQRKISLCIIAAVSNYLTSSEK